MGEARKAPVVADSSVLILFARSGQLELLHALFQRLEIPDAVKDECLSQGEHRPGAADLRRAVDDGWLHVAATPRATEALSRKHPNLGRGGTAVLALAQTRGAVALIDDGLARSAAKTEGLRVVGSLGVLALAHERGVLKHRASVEEALRLLLRSGLWAGADLVEDFWESLGGRP